MPRSDAPQLGIILLVVSNGLTASVDAIAKYLSPDLHSIQITWGFFLMIFVCLTAYALGRRVPLRDTLKTNRLGLQLTRSAMLALTLASLFIAIAYIPFADAIAISFMAPLFVTLLAVPVLGESLSYHRVAAVLIGLVGVIIIVRPGGGGLHWAYLMPLLYAVFFAIFQVMTRQLTATEDVFTTLFYTGAGGFLWVSLAVGFVWKPFGATTLLVFAVMGIMGAAAHLCIIKAFAAAQAGLLAPFSYTKVIWAILLGVVFFAETPSAATLSGTAVIIASGLYIYYHEGRRIA